MFYDFRTLLDNKCLEKRKVGSGSGKTIQTQTDPDPQTLETNLTFRGLLY